MKKEYTIFPITGLLLIGLVLIIMGLAEPEKAKIVLPSPIATPKITIIEQDPLISLINMERAKRNLKPLIQTQELTQPTQKRAEDVHKVTQWDHSGFTQAVRVASLSGIHKENIARGYASDNRVLNGWLESSTHATNLFHDCEFAAIGRAGTNQASRSGNYIDSYIVLWLGGCKP